MNAWLLRARWWQVAAVAFVVLAPLLVVLQRVLVHEPWTVAIVAGVAAAAGCAPVLAWISTRQLQDSMAAAGPLSEGDRVWVERAARRGPVPADPELRQAALRLAEDRLLTVRRTRTRALATTAVLTVVTGANAVLRSPWWWIAVGVCVGMLAIVLVAPSRVARRAALLRGDD